jgi:hypothetical protein
MGVFFNMTSGRTNCLCRVLKIRTCYYVIMSTVSLVFKLFANLGHCYICSVKHT